MTLIAKTIFQTGPDDTTAAIDVYNPEGLIDLSTSLPSALSNLTQGTLSSFTQGGSISKLLGDIDSAIKGQGKTLNSAISDIKKAVNDPGGFINTISNDLVGDMLSSVGYSGKPSELINGALGVPGSKSLGDILSANIGDVRIVSDAFDVIRKVKDVSSAQDLMALVGQITGNDDLVSLFNIGPELSVLKSVMGQLMDFRVPELYDLVSNTIKSEKDQKVLYLHSSINAARKSDLDFIQTAIGKVGAGNIISLYPDIISVMFANYRFPEGRDFADITDANRLVGIASQLQEDWDKVKFGDRLVSDLSLFKKASSPAKESFMLHPDYLIEVKLAELSTNGSLIGSLKKKYPKGAWGFQP